MNTNLNFIVCSITILLHTQTLLSMKLAHRDVFLTPTPLTQQQKDQVSQVEEDFLNGIIQYGEQNEKKTKAILTQSYDYAKKNGLINLLPDGQLKTVCNILHDINHKEGFFETAEEYIIDKVQKGILYRHKAQKAHAEQKFNLEKRYYTQAFNLFEQSLQTHTQAKKHYEDALWCGRGYDYNPLLIKNYYISQLHEAATLRNGYLSHHTYLISNKMITGALAKLYKLAKNDPDTQCTLAKIYLHGGEGISSSSGKSLELCQDAIYSLALIPTGQSLQEYDGLADIISKLCNDSAPNIQSTARILEKYFTILTAIKTQDSLQLQELAKLYEKDTTLESLAFQLLCSRVNTCIAQYLQNSTVEDTKLIEFCTSPEGELAAHILEWALLDGSYEPHIQDLFHTVLGYYNYHCNKYSGAEIHFKQCNHYQSDLYLQALTIAMDENPTSRTKNIKAILPLLHTTYTQANNKKNNAAQKIIAGICGYNSAASIENHISMCQELIPLLAVSPHSQYPFEYVRVLTGLNELRTNMNLLSEDQCKTAVKLTTYFDFFSLLQTENAQALDIFFSKKNSELTGLRRTVLQAIRGNKKCNLQKIIFESKAFSEFCISDPELIKIIAHIAKNPQKHFPINPADCNYLIAVYESIHHHYESALPLFLTCNLNDIYTMAKILEASPFKNTTSILKQCIPLVNSSQENDRNHLAHTIIGNIINTCHAPYLSLLLKEENYQEAYTFAHCLTQLSALIPSQVICNVFTTIEKSIIEKPFDIYSPLLSLPERVTTYNIIKKMAAEKNTAACDSIAFILYQHSTYPYLNVCDQTALERECLNYLCCSLKHENRKNDNDKQIKKSLCAKLACTFGTAEKSVVLLDKAIKYGSARALYQKANLLLTQKNIAHLPHILNLLEEHIASNDDDVYRAKSYRSLGEYYYTIKDVEYQKKAFDYLKAAVDLNDYDAGYLLALMYLKGQENTQDSDIKQAFVCLEKTINGKKKHYLDALYIRALTYYGYGEYGQAYKDLKDILYSNADDDDDSHKALVYWLIGLVKLHTEDNLDISDTAIAYLSKAYAYAFTHKLTNPDSSYIKNFILHNDENTLILINQHIDHILNNKKTDAASLDFCSAAGSVLFEQCQDKPISDFYRTIALKSIIYAAEKGQIDAALALLYADQHEVDTWDKIYYLLLSQPQDPSVADMIQSILMNLHPADVISQSLLIQRLSEKANPAALQNYTSQIYESEKPVAIDPVFYSCFPQENTEQLIKTSSSFSSLMQLADGFMKNPTKSTPQEHFMAIWYGSLLTYSLDQKLLIKGACYLETSRKYFPLMQKEHIEKNLGYLYYKLGWRQSELNNRLLALSYLEKGAIFNDENCIKLLTKLRPNTTEKKGTPDKQLQPKKLQQSDNEARTITEQFSRYNNVDNHLDLHLLVYNPTDMKNIRKSCTSAIDNIMNDPDGIMKCKNPLVFFAQAATIYGNGHNNELLKIYIEKGFLYGTIKANASSHNMFKDAVILSSVCDLITGIIKRNNNTQMNILLKAIKQGLTTYNMDIKAFERFYKSLYKINIAQNNIWKKIK